jgi:hypothetical protein
LIKITRYKKERTFSEHIRLKKRNQNAMPLIKKLMGIHKTKTLIGERKMKRKWFVLNTIAAIAIVGMFVFENTAAAHEITRNKNESRNAGRGRIARMVNPVSALNQSWLDLTFGVKADQETLAKALPIYQETREALQTQIKEAREADTKRAAARKLRGAVKETYTKFNASLKEVLTEEQMTKLTELKEKRRTEVRERLNESRRNQRERRNQQERRNQSERRRRR